MIKDHLRHIKLVYRLFYGLRIDDIIANNGLCGFDAKINANIKKYQTKGLLKDENIKSLRSDIKKCYVKYKCLPSEYFLFDFLHKDEEERATYVTDTYIYSNLGLIVGRFYFDEQLRNKINFYKLMEPFFKRVAIRVGDPSDYLAFENMALETKYLIIKPNSESHGIGIFATTIETKDDAKTVFEKMMKEHRTWIVEERLDQVKEMSQFNQSSLNTIRVSTFLNNRGFFPLSSIIRTGRAGSVVDNANQGGVSAAIDFDSGKIISDGIDFEGNRYVCHPDSKVVFRGTVIPRWKELMQTVEKAHRTIPNHIYVGWDFALTPNGWALIEGNWGQLGAQQLALGYGLKPKFDEYLAGGVLE